MTDYSKGYIRDVAKLTVKHMLESQGIPPWAIEEGYISISDGDAQQRLSMELQRIGSAIKVARKPKPKFPKTVLDT